MTTYRRHDRPSREWLRRTAEAEDRCESVTVGGLAADVDMLSVPPVVDTPRVFGRLIEFARRSRGLPAEDLAREAGVELAELLAVESAERVPTADTVIRLAAFLQFSTAKLMELAGLAEPKDQSLSHAARRFAVRSETTDQLTPDEREALEEFVKAIVESSD